MDHPYNTSPNKQLYDINPFNIFVKVKFYGLQNISFNWYFVDHFHCADFCANQEFEGRKLTVNEARPMEARPPRTGGNDRGGYGGNGGGRREY